MVVEDSTETGLASSTADLAVGSIDISSSESSPQPTSSSSSAVVAKFH